MKKIDIQITKAQITSFAVELKEDLPDVTAVISLYTENMKKITNFSLSTVSWQDRTFELPPQMIPAIKKIAQQLENIIVHECNKELSMIEYKT